MTLITVVLFGVLGTTVAALKNESGVCGQAFTRKSEPGQDKVIVGPNTHLGDWPWLAYLQACDDHDCWSCSASLVSENYIISASHCYESCYPDCGTSVTSFVRVGSVDDKEGGQLFGVERVHFFNNDTSVDDLMFDGHDIVVAKLNASVTFSDTVSPICLSEAKLEDHTTYVVAIGYGQACPDNSSCVDTESSRESIIPLKSVEYCRSVLPNPVADSDICAGSDHRQSTRGDSGGPVQFELNKRWSLAGVTSRGPPEPQVEDFIGHATYARVSIHCEWIASVTNGEVGCSKE
ncbi:chymotrypsinogen 2-like protein [Aphelenchoides avenae]|nr:chymotrypsinogen 2-like protein [Aphelenchus avenae]